MNTDLEECLKRNLTERAVGASAMRGQARKGGIAKVREALLETSVEVLGRVKNQTRFRVWLDQETDRISRNASRHGVRWGTARKALNLWLRDIAYNHYFRSGYGLERVEPWLEVPLDSYTAKFIRAEIERQGLILLSPLPPWTTVKAVTPAFSEAYQDAAGLLVGTRAYGYLRDPVHIDLVAWRNSRESMRGGQKGGVAASIRR